jgi:NAD(P)-dependent dehydrogenase (short-subunit alcohol dehydrogenase family)
MLGDGACRRCRRGHQHVCENRHEVGIRGGRPGALAEQVAVPVASLHELPDSVDVVLGALVEPGGNALRSAEAADVGRGDRVLVLGPGTIGLLVAMFARAAGAEVHLLGLSDGSLDVARLLGFEHVWSEDDLPDAPFDAIVDASNAVHLPARAVGRHDPRLRHRIGRPPSAGRRDRGTRAGRRGARGPAAPRRRARTQDPCRPSAQVKGTLMNEFTGLVALVTGGANGIGAATALRLQSLGARVAVLDRDTDGAPEGTLAVPCDVTDAAGVDRAVTTVVESLSSLDIVVNSAGVGAIGDVSQNTDDDWARVLDVNITGIARVTRAALPHLRRSEHAVVVNMCSVVALVGVKQRALYSASKGAVLALTLAMAADHVAEGIRVNAVAPGTADTAWVGRLLDAADDPAAAEALRARQPLGRLISADEVAHAVVTLASPRAASTTGTILSVDGGMASLRV